MPRPWWSRIKYISLVASAGRQQTACYSSPSHQTSVYPYQIRHCVWQLLAAAGVNSRLSVTVVPQTTQHCHHRELASRCRRQSHLSAHHNQTLVWPHFKMVPCVMLQLQEAATARLITPAVRVWWHIQVKSVVPRSVSGVMAAPVQAGVSVLA